MSDRHTFPLIAGRLKNPFPHTREVQTVGPSDGSHRRQRVTLPMDGDEIDLSSVGLNAILAFTCDPDQTHYRRVVEITETTITLRTEISLKGALESVRRHEWGGSAKQSFPLWDRKEFDTKPLWFELRDMVPGWHGAEAAQ